jgi:hypothetical protein
MLSLKAQYKIKISVEEDFEIKTGSWKRNIDFTSLSLFHKWICQNNLHFNLFLHHFMVMSMLSHHQYIFMLFTFTYKQTLQFIWSNYLVQNFHFSLVNIAWSQLLLLLCCKPINFWFWVWTVVNIMNCVSFLSVAWAEQRGYLTAKAGRNDTYRAG